MNNQEKAAKLAKKLARNLNASESTIAIAVQRASRKQLAARIEALEKENDELQDELDRVADKLEEALEIVFPPDEDAAE